MSDDDLRKRAEQAAGGLRRLLELIEAGELDAPESRVWHLRGALRCLAVRTGWARSSDAIP